MPKFRKNKGIRKLIGKNPLILLFHICESYVIVGFRDELIIVMRIVIVLLISILSFQSQAQEVYNSCSEALVICPNSPTTVNNIGANKTFCPGCEDDFNYCFAPNNSIWLTFTSNSLGGDAQIDFSNLVFESNLGQDVELQATILLANIPCNAASYTLVGDCAFNETSNFTLNAFGLSPDQAYYIVISGDMNGVGITSAAECTFDIEVSGTGVDQVQPTVAFTSEPTGTLCPETSVTFSAELTNCADPSVFNWYINNELVAVTNEPTFTTAAIENADKVYVETSCYSYCPVIARDSTEVLSVYEFTVDAGLDATIELGEVIQLDGTTDATAYNWSPSFYLSDPTLIDPLATPDVTITYTLTGEFNGCIKTDYVVITVDSGLFFPNTFSPNGDGTNDQWVIRGIEKYPDCDVRIYDRWGQELYQATGYSGSKAWDGTTKAGKVPAGVYFYKVSLRDEAKQVLSGNITLIR